MNTGNYSNEKNMRNVVRRALQLMNRYGLTELEYENKEGDEVIRLQRRDTSTSPPLLEGRTAELTGQVRSPGVGEIQWKYSEGDEIDEGDVVAEIQKHNESVRVTSPRAGKLAHCFTGDHVQYGDVLFSVIPPDQPESSEKEEESS